MLTVNGYLSGIPKKNKNPEKPLILSNFVEGVNRCGDIGEAVTGDWSPSDVAVIQGYVHKDSPDSPHLTLRKRVLDQQKKNNKHTVIVDSNLFLFADPGNTKTYLRYSLDGVFPSTGNYFWDNPDINRWHKIRKDLSIKYKDWRNNGDHILICLQRNGGWSMKGLDNQDWAIDIVHRLRKYTDRPIWLRGHPGDKRAGKYLDLNERACRLDVLKGVNVHIVDHRNRTLEQDLKNAWATVVYNSSPAVASAITGIPVFADDIVDCQARDVASNDISQIENPVMGDRENWLSKLAMCHWNFSELKDGSAWRHMRQYV
jgi:hypothetical protein